MMAAAYQSLKLFLLQLFGVTKDAAHISVGLIGFWLWVGLFKRRLDSLKSVLPVLGLALFMELMDFQDMFNAHRPYNWLASAHDLILTCFWPTAIVLLFKFGIVRRKRDEVP